MTVTDPSRAPARGLAWWMAWALIAALLLGGVYLAVRHVNAVPPAIVARA